jgi:uncharacterized membrane protein YkvA (DUF1232 family)
MSEMDSQCLETFPTWLRTLGEDAEKLGTLLADESLPEPLRETVAGGLNYLFKSLDLIPDGIDDIGFLDDAFVIRVAADLGLGTTDDVPAEVHAALTSLANDCELIRDFLAKDYARLEAYVKGLRKGAARGRSVGDILGNAEVREAFLGEVRGFATSYAAPSFAREERNLIKLRAYFEAKLPK